MVMFKKKRKVSERQPEEHQWIEFQERYKSVKRPFEAITLLQDTIDVFGNVDKHMLEELILFLRQNAEDHRYKYYRARCMYIVIPPEHALAFWISYVLGSLPENTRFSVFESEVQELHKVLLQMSEEKEKTINLKLTSLYREIETAFSLIKDKFPIFFRNVTREPIMVPVMDFSIKSGSVLSIPRLNCVALMKTRNQTEHPLISTLHSLVHILHYRLTEDLEVLPPGFANTYDKLFDELILSSKAWAEAFAETVVSSILYETEYMPLVAYLELSQEDHKEIANYLSWLEMIYASSLQDNMQKLILKSVSQLRA